MEGNETVKIMDHDILHQLKAKTNVDLYEKKKKKKEEKLVSRWLTQFSMFLGGFGQNPLVWIRSKRKQEWWPCWE